MFRQETRYVHRLCGDVVAAAAGVDDGEGEANAFATDAVVVAVVAETVADVWHLLAAKECLVNASHC